jgi:hypothetical protein
VLGVCGLNCPCKEEARTRSKVLFFRDISELSEITPVLIESIWFSLWKLDFVFHSSPLYIINLKIVYRLRKLID